MLVEPREPRKPGVFLNEIYPSHGSRFVGRDSYRSAI